MIINMANHKPDLVTVAGKHYTSFSTGVDANNQVAMNISVNLIRVSGHSVANNPLNWNLKTGWRGCT